MAGQVVKDDKKNKKTTSLSKKNKTSTVTSKSLPLTRPSGIEVGSTVNIRKHLSKGPTVLENSPKKKRKSEVTNSSLQASGVEPCFNSTELASQDASITSQLLALQNTLNPINTIQSSAGEVPTINKLNDQNQLNKLHMLQMNSLQKLLQEQASALAMKAQREEAAAVALIAPQEISTLQKLESVPLAELKELQAKVSARLNHINQQQLLAVDLHNLTQPWKNQTQVQQDYFCQPKVLINQQQSKGPINVIQKEMQPVPKESIIHEDPHKFQQQ